MFLGRGCQAREIMAICFDIIFLKYSLHSFQYKSMCKPNNLDYATLVILWLFKNTHSLRKTRMSQFIYAFIYSENWYNAPSRNYPKRSKSSHVYGIST